MDNNGKLWNSNYNKVMVTNFCLYFAFYITMPLLPIYLSEHFGATKDTIGVVLAGYTLAALLVRPSAATSSTVSTAGRFCCCVWPLIVCSWAATW